MFFLEFLNGPLGCLFLLAISVVLYSIGASGVTFLFGVEDSATRLIAGLCTLIVGWVALFAMFGSEGKEITYTDDGYPIE